MEEKEEGISIGEILHVMFIKKWLMLAVTLIITLIGVVFVQAFYNPKKVEYQATFEVRYPNQETGRFPDGTEYLYKEFVSLSNLIKARDSSEDFSNINVEAMKRNNDISIRENENIINNIPVKTGTYTIFILSKYFTSSDQAANFFLALISIPADSIIEKSKLIDYDRYLKQYSTVGDYSSQVDLLMKQRDLIINGYDKLIQTYSTAHTIMLSDGSTKSITEEQSEIESYFTFYDLKSMKIEVEMNGYVHRDSDFLNTIRSEIAVLEREKEENDKKLTSLTQQIDDLRNLLGETVVTETAFQSIITSISAITERNAEIDHLIHDVYSVYIDKTENPEYEQNLADFEARLDNHYQKLEEFTNRYTLFNNEIYETNTKILVSAGSIITQTGGYGVLIVFAAFLVIGFVFACCLNLVLDLPKFLREKKNGTKEVEVVVEEETKE